MATGDGELRQQDSALVALHLSGDPSAFETLYNAYYHRLLRFVRKRVRQSEVVEDIASEAFARAYAAIEGLRDTSRFYPWLTMITRRLIIDHYRQRSRISLVADLDLGVSDDAPEGLLLAQQDHADVSAAMARIRGRHREVLELREHREMSYEEIAAHLGVPITTVPPLLYRARVALRREYLLITEGEGTAAYLPLVVLIGDAIRRLRERAAHLVSMLPDPTALTGSVLMVAVSLGAFMPSMAQNRVGPPLDGWSAREAKPGPEPGFSAAPVDRPPHAATDQGVSQPSSKVEAFGIVSLHDHEAARRGRERDRRAPIYFEHGDDSLSLDPGELRRDVESSLTGDHSWFDTEGDTE